MEKAQEGDVFIRGNAVNDLQDDARTSIRRQDLGFVYQYHYLLAEFSARENIMVPQMIAGVPKAGAQNKADDLLTAMGLIDRAMHRPARLSGGEQQRVAIARALPITPPYPGRRADRKWSSRRACLLFVGKSVKIGVAAHRNS